MHTATEQSLWSGRQSSTLQYWHQAVQCIEDIQLDVHSHKTIGILGYAGDEGVKRNQGRPGAAEAPQAIRKMMAPMAFHLPNDIRILDLGDIHTEQDKMEESHQQITGAVKKMLAHKVFPLLLGGGHDLAYAHGKAVLEYLQEKGEKLGIINLDAHFDLRGLVNGKGHSGSPFYQLAKDFPKDFHYLCLGIQQAANPSELFERAKELKVEWMHSESFTIQHWEQISETLDSFCQKVNKIYLSIDLDGFSSAYAPGVSAPSPLGFHPDITFKVLEWIASSGKLISIDLVELNPKFDQDNATARLAARCAEFILRKKLNAQTIG